MSPRFLILISYFFHKLASYNSQIALNDKALIIAEAIALNDKALIIAEAIVHLTLRGKSVYKSQTLGPIYEQK